MIYGHIVKLFAVNLHLTFGCNNLVFKGTEKRKKEVLKSINEYSEKMDKIISSISEYDSILSEYSTAISEIRTDLNNAKTRFKTIEDKISQKEQNLSYWKREYDSANSVIERMIMQIENHNKDIDVYNDSIKRHVQELDELKEKPLDNLAELQKPMIEHLLVSRSFVFPVLEVL
jgi:chromosome segregation ATPase